jgi:hypothetical protein
MLNIIIDNNLKYLFYKNTYLQSFYNYILDIFILSISNKINIIIYNVSSVFGYNYFRLENLLSISLLLLFIISSYNGYITIKLFSYIIPGIDMLVFGIRECYNGYIFYLIISILFIMILIIFSSGW